MSTVGKTITCRAAVLYGVNDQFVIEEVKVAVPKKGEVRIKMASTGICHSDQHFLEGVDKNLTFPTVLGHEGAGVIESVGPDVNDFEPGDCVVLLFEGYCGECDACKNPKTPQCLKQPRNHLQLDGTSRISRNGQELSQMVAISTFCEYTVTATMNVTKVNPKAPMNRLCLAGCCIPTGFGAVVNRAKVTPGAKCAVWGLGGVGMNVVLACKESKASQIIGVDLNPSKFPLAKEFGCTDLVNSKEEPNGAIEKIMKLTNGGADYCFVSVGSKAAMEEAFNSSHPMWGETIVIGITDMDVKIEVGVWPLLFGRQIKGTYYGSCKAKLEIPGIVDKIVNGQIPLNKLITHVISLNQINEGFELLKNGKSLRTVIDFEMKNEK